MSLAVRLDSGPEAGGATTVSLPDETARQDVEVGDEIRVLALDPASGLGLEQALLGGGDVERSYVFVDFERGTPLAALAAGALVLTALLAALFVELGSITGVVGDEATLLGGAGEGTSPLPGLVLAGAVIGMLGVLGALAVAQASTVMALRRANPAHSLRRLHAAALTIARERIGSRSPPAWPQRWPCTCPGAP